METKTTTPVGILQELIALHITRKEAVEKITEGESEDDAALEFVAASQQSERFVSELMNELSGFGDAVQADTNRDNEYHAIWKKKSADVNTMSRAEKMQFFQLMEDSLHRIYGKVLETKDTLPESMQELLAHQEVALNR